jgi:hypothetical protein
LGQIGWAYELLGVAMVYWGDFNVIQYPSERSANTQHSPNMLEFSEFNFAQSLMDIPLLGGNFTQSNNRDHQSWSKIDKFLLS